MPKIKLNGLKMSYSARGEGDPLLLLHGLSIGKSLSDEFIDELAQYFYVVTYDQRGLGESEVANLDYSLTDLADDAIALLDYIEIEQASVAGFSFGGVVVQELLLRYPQRFNRAMMACTYPGGVKHGEEMVYDEDARLAYSLDTSIPARNKVDALARTLYTQGFIEQHPEIIEPWKQSRMNRELSDNVIYRQDLYLEYDVFSKLKNIKQPTLVMAGKQDSLIPYKNSEVLAAQLPNAQLVALEPCGHELWVEQKQEMLKNIISFFKQ
ncbi:MAG: alpha/beta hydrolase [Coxiellaceae bacterium]|nr:alpha/beta hydrolase [Coxiellaceae bacterium]